MEIKNELSGIDSIQDSTKVTRVDEASVTGAVATERRRFVEPEVSSPVSVLEATTFFQATDSGVTN